MQHPFSQPWEAFPARPGQRRTGSNGRWQQLPLARNDPQHILHINKTHSRAFGNPRESFAICRQTGFQLFCVNLLLTFAVVFFCVQMHDSSYSGRIKVAFCFLPNCARFQRLPVMNSLFQSRSDALALSALIGRHANAPALVRPPPRNSAVGCQGRYSLRECSKSLFWLYHFLAVSVISKAQRRSKGWSQLRFRGGDERQTGGVTWSNRRSFSWRLRGGIHAVDRFSRGLHQRVLDPPEQLWMWKKHID